MALASITVWKDRANATKITLTKDGTALTSEEMSAITKVDIHYLGSYYGSDTYSNAFDITTYAATGQILIKPGLLPLEVNSDVAELIIYDSDNLDGIMWMQIAMQVRGDATV